ncbi:nucleoside-diphosphate kinase [Candidatus Parcubacteria bacterium]|nr:nucleoside-diphosphate kinase [Candidatus Parcubacteria bacterium]
MKKEQTLVVIKPDGIQRTLIGEIIKRFERTGLKLVGIKMLIPDSDHIKKHYTIDPDWIEKVGQKSIDSLAEKGEELKTDDPIEAGNKILDVLVKYMSSGPVVAMVWQGVNSVGVVRKIVGSTEPLSSDIGTIRGDFVLDSYKIADTDGRAVRNLIHASGSVDEAEKEIALWFNQNEIVNYRLIQEQIIYDVNLDGILE